MERRDFLRTSLGVTVGAGLVAALGARALRAQQALPTMTVYKSPTCGCCTAWVEHARGAGFTVRTVDTDDLDRVKREVGLPARLASCHTVMVGSYVVEGHVPASDIKRLLTERPAVRGLAVPGMPIGSPGMEQGPPAGYQRYDVLAFTSEGRTTVFASHGPPARAR